MSKATVYSYIEVSSLPVICEFSRFIRGPLDKVFAWCTDYEPEDIRFHPWARSRKIVSRSKDQVVIASETMDGIKRIVTVKLMPPDRWEAFTDDGLHIIYTLARVEGGTRFTFRGEASGPNIPAAASERLSSAEETWDSIIPALEKEVPP